MTIDDAEFPAETAYREVAQGILDAIETGHAGAYVMPWHGIDRVPTNPITGRRFSGSNACALWAGRRRFGCKSHYWASERAWVSKGGTITDPSKGIGVFVPVFDELQKTPYSRKLGPLGGDPMDPTGNRIIGFKRWTVFNQDHQQGAQIAEPALPHDFTPIEAAQRLANGYQDHGGPALVYGGAVACFVPKFDRIHMPPREAFAPREGMTSNQLFYSVLLHEMIHSTGTPNRLARKVGNGFGSQDYAREELVAELGSAFLCARIGLSTQLRANHASYVASWLEILRGQKGQGAFAAAVALGTRAADFLLAKARWVEHDPNVGLEE